MGVPGVHYPVHHRTLDPRARQIFDLMHLPLGADGGEKNHFGRVVFGSFCELVRVGKGGPVGDLLTPTSD